MYLKENISACIVRILTFTKRSADLSPHPMVGNFQALGMPYLVSVFVDLGFWTAPEYLTMCWCGGFWVMQYQLNLQKVWRLRSTTWTADHGAPVKALDTKTWVSVPEWQYSPHAPHIVAKRRSHHSCLHRGGSWKAWVGSPPLSKALPVHFSSYLLSIYILFVVINWNYAYISFQWILPVLLDNS